MIASILGSHPAHTASILVRIRPGVSSGLSIALSIIPPLRRLEKRATLIHDIPEDQVEAEIIAPDGHPIGIEFIIRQEHIEQPVFKLGVARRQA